MTFICIFSWHELWTSGLRDSNSSIHLNDEENQSNEQSTTTTAFPITSTTLSPASPASSLNKSAELICSKNVDSIFVIDFINYAYFIICILIYVALILNSVLIYLKLKKKFYEFTQLVKLGISSQEHLSVRKSSYHIDDLYSNILVTTNENENPNKANDQEV